MTTKPHHKHGKIAKPDYGKFGRNEWTLLGAPCGMIHALANQLAKGLGPQVSVAYLDADHQAEPSVGSANFASQYTNKINHHQWVSDATPTQAEQWRFFQQSDVVLVNGNHFEGANQLVIIHPKKYDSVKKRLGQLNQVAGWLFTEGETEPFDFLKEAFPNWQDIPSRSLTDIKGLVGHIQQGLEETQTPPNGLVLAGGKSQRMGKDKTQINYHGKPQKEHLYALMKQRLSHTWLSCRPDQVASLPATFEVLPDAFLGIGPYGAILSALQHRPNQAWLVVAIDMPFVSLEAIEQLLSHRNPYALATAFKNPENDLPEPLLAIWEPKAYPHLLNLLAQGISCPRKALILAQDTHLVTPKDPNIIKNINTPEDLASIRNSI